MFYNMCLNIYGLHGVVRSPAGGYMLEFVFHRRGFFQRNIMTKIQFIDRRTRIISKLLEAPKEDFSVHPTTVCYAELDDLFDELMKYNRGASWAQIERDAREALPEAQAN